MNFSQLKTDICKEIESILACYWSTSRLAGRKVEAGSKHAGGGGNLHRRKNFRSGNFDRRQLLRRGILHEQFR